MKYELIKDLSQRRDELATGRYWLKPAFMISALLLPTGYVVANQINGSIALHWSFTARLLLAMLPMPLCVALVVVFSWCWLKDSPRPLVVELGLGRPTWAMFREAAAALGIIIVTVPLITWGVFKIMHLFKVEAKGARLAEVYLNSPPEVMILIAVFAVILAPLSEELLFRRIIFGFMAGHFGIWPSMACTAAFFAFFHDANVQYLGLFLLGLALQILYLRHRSLWPSVMLHAMNNALTLSLLCICRMTNWIPPDWM